MKIAIIGFGKMGQIIAQIAVNRNHEIISIDSHSKFADASSLDILNDFKVDCAIEFTQPESAVSNIKKLLELNIPTVVGTTGWYENLEQVKSLTEKSKTALLYSANFSVGVNIFNLVIAQASKLFSKFKEYDQSLIEYHHNQKADSPSGTALKLADTILKNNPNKKKLLTESPNRKIEAEELQVISLRCGAFPGEHKVIFDSQADTVTLSHSARSREGFALGAVIAGEWLATKKGFYTMDDMFKELLEA